MVMEDESSRATPPYAAWTTTRNLLERMQNEGVPARIDRTYLQGMSGGTQNHVMAALRSLGLIDDEGAPLDRLRDIVDKPEQRPSIMAQLLRERFPDLVALDANATRGQLDEVLAGYGLSGATARKSASFFVQAAEYADLEISPHIKAKRRPSTTGTSSRKTASRKRKTASGTDSAPPDTNSETLTLVSGGVVTMAVSVNLFELDKEDRDFVLDLIDKIKGYKRVGQASTNSDGPT